MRFHPLRPTALIVAALLLGCGGAAERKADHLKKAIGYFDQANSEKASIEFKNVLQIDPKAAQPYYYLGRLEEDKKNWQQAFGFYSKAVELDPNYRDAQFRLARFLLMGRDIGKAEEMLAPVLKERPTDVEVRLLHIAIDKAKGDEVGSMAALQALVDEKPTTHEAYLVLALLKAQQKDTVGAEAVLKNGLAVIPNSMQLLESLMRLYGETKRFDQAEAVAKQMIETQPGEFKHRMALVQVYAAQSRWAEAEQAIRTAAKDFPGDAKPTLALAEFFLRRGNLQQAEQELTAGVAAHPESLDLRKTLASILERTKKAKEAEQTYRDFLAKNEDTPDGLKAQAALGEMLARQGRYPESLAFAEAILKDHPQDRQALLLKGKIALTQKNAQDAIAAFRSILKEQPDDTDVLALLAGAFQLDGKTALVQENLERAVQIKPADFGVRRALVQFHVQQKNIKAAMEQVTNFLKSQPDNLDGMNLKADLLAVDKDGEALEEALQEVKEKFPTQPIGSMRLGNFYFNQKNYEAALKEFQSAVEKSHNAYDPLKSLVSAYVEMNQGDKALATLNKLLAETPNNAGIQQLIGSVNLVLGRQEDGVAAMRKAMEIAPNWLQPYVNLGAFYEQKGQIDDAAATYRKAITTAADDFGAQLELNSALANLLVRNNELDQAEQVYREFILKAQDHPEADKAKLALAETLGRHERYDDAGALVNELLVDKPNDAPALLLKGRLALSQKMADEAMGIFEGLRKDQPNSMEIVNLLITSAQVKGDAGKALEYAESATKLAPNDLNVRRAYVELLLREKEVGKAIGHMDEFTKLNPDSVDGLNMKAELLALNKDAEGAAAVLKDVRARFPDNPQAALRLGAFYKSQKQLDAALTEFEEARKLSHDAYDPLLASVSVLMETQKADKALALAKSAIVANPKNAGAYQVLGLIQTNQNKGSEAVQAFTKAIELNPRWLLPYASLGGYYEKQQQVDAALGVYQKAMSAVPDDVNMQMLAARAHEEKKQYAQAMALYESILKKAPNNLAAINNLASLLSLPGAKDDEIARALKLATPLEQTSEPAFWDTLAWLHYLTNSLPKAAELQSKVVEKSPQVPIFQYHLGMILAKQGDTAGAKAHLEKSLEPKTDFIGIEDARASLKAL